MNHVVEEMRAILDGDEEALAHYGMPRRSGRYPWGSGDDPYQHNIDFLGRVKELKKEGKTEREIADIMGLYNDNGEPSSSRLRARVTIANDERRLYEYKRCKALSEDGKGPTEIERETGIPESTVRSILSADRDMALSKARETANIIKKEVDSRGMIDVGVGVERELNISAEKLNAALDILREEGYPIYKGGIPQVTNPGKQTNMTVICPPGTEHKEIYDFKNVHSLKEYISRDGGETYEKKFYYPESIDSKRVKVLLKDEIGPDGEPGVNKDGLIQIRRGVADLSLGESRYCQVRILVDKDKYLKGMAVYSDNLPDGIDVLFNSNKERVEDAFKKIKKDPDNPFGSLIKDADQGGQYWYDADTGKRCSANDPNVKNKKLGLINKRADEGDWDEWADALPSQFLGKQSLSMAKKQLNLAKVDKFEEFDTLCSLNNPTIKKHLLEKFADECDSAAVHLKAAALPGQKYHAIIPINTLKDTEVYAPNYENGTKLALIRYPHGGTFEIPILTVNNKHAPAKKLLGTDSIDAVGISKSVADRLSGADFDGDTVMCIPTHDKSGKVKIASSHPLKGLEGFDPKTQYGHDRMTEDSDGTKHYFDITGREFKAMRNTGTEMGVISNLITDMTLAGAGPDDLAKAVRHSMVVIDAEKHGLDYKKSEIDNNISALKKQYQRSINPDGTEKVGGASTILSRSKGEATVLKRQGTPKINIKGEEWYDPSKPEGSLIYKTADDLTYEVTRTNKRTGETTTVTKYKTQKSTRMAETDDANTLVSTERHPMELIYADYVNSMKSLANKARIEMVNTGKIDYDPAAKATYAKEVASLKSKLNTALLNATREREAQRRANAEVQEKEAAYKAETGEKKMKSSDRKKASQQAISKYRKAVSSISRRDRNIEITDREWEAIQAGAIHENTLKKILANADTDILRQRATPRTVSTLSTSQQTRIQNLRRSGKTIDEIAKALGKSTSTISKYLKGSE
jgi:DNA-binding CsgD family transcriptional regulator